MTSDWVISAMIFIRPRPTGHSSTPRLKTRRISSAQLERRRDRGSAHAEPGGPSGSPVLDEVGNRVLGILFGGEGKQLYFTPASALRRVLEDPTRQPVPLEQALPHWASTARH